MIIRRCDFWLLRGAVRLRKARWRRRESRECIWRLCISAVVLDQNCSLVRIHHLVRSWVTRSPQRCPLVRKLCSRFPTLPVAKSRRLWGREELVSIAQSGTCVRLRRPPRLRLVGQLPVGALRVLLQEVAAAPQQARARQGLVVAPRRRAEIRLRHSPRAVVELVVEVAPARW